MAYDNLRSELKTAAISKFKFSILDFLYDVLVLPFDMELQTQTNWCWAATSKSVSHFYSWLSPWTQCKIASAELNQTCCQSTVPAACNVPWYLDKALTRTNNFVSIQSGTVSWETVRDQLEAGLVVGARIGWNNGGGHFMVIHGVTRIGFTEYLHIDDPIYGKSTLTYSQFATNYQSSGSWTHTYFTKKYFYFMWFKDLVFSPELLDPIPPVKHLVPFFNKKLLRREINPAGEYSMPHQAYILELNSLRENFELPEQPKTLRVVEFDQSEPMALYEVGLDESRPELIQMNTNPNYFVKLDEAIGKLKRIAERNKIQGELRLLRVPALNVEAFWLHYDEGSDDIITPLNLVQNDTRFDWNKPYNVQEFKNLLREISASIDPNDDLLGA